jgi:signal transduction histidine kinase
MFGSIRWKLSVTYLIVVSSALVLMAVHLSSEFETVYTRRSTTDLLNFARVVATHAYQGLSTGDPADVRLHLRGVPNDRIGARFVIIDASGSVVAVVGAPESTIGTRDTKTPVTQALAGAEVTGIDRLHGSEAAVYAAVPVPSGSAGRVVGAVYAWLPMALLGAELQHIRWVIAGSVSAALLLAAALGAVLARGIAGPIQEMQRVASRLASGRLSERVPVRSRDELGELARSLNFMAGELERIDATRRAFIADASHELRTPVANLAVAVEALQAVIGKDSNEARAAAADLEREAKRLTELVENLLDLSLAESGQVRLNATVLSPGDLALRAMHPFEGRAAQVGVTLATEIPLRLSQVTADADRTVQVLTNLLDNALKVTPAGGRITVAASEQRAHVLLSVADTGPGIPETELPHVFDRFYRVDKARAREKGGAGLGLAIAKRLVEAQGGIIMVESELGHGARFVVALPKAPNQSAG